jgi:hypothetical protein
VTILEEATKIVDGPREDNYGHPALNFERTRLIWMGILHSKLTPGSEITCEEVALMMVGLKLAREVHKPTRDNLVDGCGYLRCIEKIQQLKESQQ